MDDLKAEIWYEMQRTLFVENTAVYLAGTDGASVLSQNGKKYHKPIISKPRSGPYTPYSDITYRQKTASKQTLSVDTYEYAADEIDWTDKSQMMEYSPTSDSARNIQKVLNNRIEQYFLSEVTSAKNVIDGATVGGADGSLVGFSGASIFDVFEAADTKLGSADAPSQDRALVAGPHMVSAIRKLKSQRETPLGDTVLANGVIGAWNGYTIVQNNNLPWSATLAIATQPTDGDTVVFSGVTLTFKTALTPTAGEVLIGASAATARANLAAALAGTGTPGTDYVELDEEDAFTIREKRHLRATTGANMAVTGFGDIVVSETLTAAADGFSAQRQDAIFMPRGAIDLVVQIDPNNIRIIEKEKGFADLVKALLGLGTQMFDDGARVSVYTKIDASLWK